MKIQRAFSGAPWEEQVGYCRAIRKGNFIAVSGTTPIGDDGKVFEPKNAYAQTIRCFEIIEAALKKVGASLGDVIRTRMFVTDISQFEEYGRAHAAIYKSFPPATSMVEVKSLVNPEMLIEIEVDAISSETT
jgi:enamine deaminase RidA (YjgF/YER057c/UK114 family)